MVSRRNFFSITAMMLVILCLFQGPQIITDGFELQYNGGISSGANLNSESVWTQPEQVEEGKAYVMFVGQEKSAIYNTVANWCNYMKQPFSVKSELPAPNETGGEKIIMLVLTSDVLDLDTDVKTLEAYLEMGTTVVFADLPDVRQIEANEALRKLLGINEIRANVTTVDGIHLYEGFLLGGDVLYQEKETTANSRQDLQLTMPWYCTGSGSQVFMAGEIEGAGTQETELKRGELPAIIWSHTDGQGKLYAVNGSYMEEVIGIGILSAMLADSEKYLIYPVVNAQVLTVANFPGMADENKEVMKNEFNASMTQVNRDVIYPELAALSSQVDFRMTCMMYPQYDYTDDAEPNFTQYEFYVKELKELDSELGVSVVNDGGLSLNEKINQDNSFWERVNSERNHTALYIEPAQSKSVLENVKMLGDIKTIVWDNPESHQLISYADTDITLQGTTANAYEYTYSADFRNRSLETALAYVNILLDVNRILWPEDGEANWIQTAKTITTNLSTGWKAFQDLMTRRQRRRIRRSELFFAWIMTIVGQKPRSHWFWKVLRAEVSC